LINTRERNLELKWETDEAGNLRLPRLIGYQSGVAEGEMLICQLRVANSVEEFRAAASGSRSASATEYSLRSATPASA
jgi:hypothetical protein